ncbi:DNA mismatch repair protein MutL [uncultured archaeon]|nr:DNA mismatch repair protein MutL [uncultured archaeon]
MAKIRLLDADTINKIAAGEVIERPASAVKELVENSIDAGASRVQIEIEDGGKSLIRVTDDGCGIEPEDLFLAFQKHATSKIRDANDLENISTLGFRGEALASIASVSRSVEVRTKTRGAISGMYLLLENGKVVQTKEIGCPVGTIITVWDLFSNVPARRKHLKGKEAETVHILDTISEMSLINYRVAFELFGGKRSLFKSARSDNWNKALLNIFGLNTLRAMFPLQAEGRGWCLEGVAGGPLCTRSSPDRVFIFVTGRAVYSRALLQALREAYRNIIPLGKSPVAVISLKIEPGLVDVNVHPAKIEIRLLHEEVICQALTDAVSQALQRAAKPATVLSPDKSASCDLHTLADTAQSCQQQTLPLQDPEVEERPSIAKREPMRLKILGQVLRLYIVAEGEAGLVLVDQHAAAERIRFERLCERYRNRKIKQELAEPVAIELSASEQVMLSTWQETLEAIGFEIYPFGGNTYSVRSVPALGARLESAEAVHDVLRDLFRQGKVAPGSSNRDDILKLLACKGSIKSGKELSMVQMKSLIEELGLCTIRSPALTEGRLW